MTMKRTILILLAILTMAPVALRAQESTAALPSWGFGFHVGVGGMVPTGSLADELKVCALFAGGLDFGYNRLRLRLDASYAQPSFKNVNPYAVYDDQGRNLQLNATANPTLLGFTAQLGYTVWQQGRVSVTPMVGFTASRLSWDINHIKYEKDEDDIERPLIKDVTGCKENTFGWSASVDVDVKLHGTLVDFPAGPDGQARYTSSLRISPLVTYGKLSKLNPSVKGCCVGLTVSYAGFLRILK